MPQVHDSLELPRGCGYRQKGGKYLISAPGVPTQPCGRLPIILDVCPTCSEGVKPSRGWTTIEPRPFLEHHPCSFEQDPDPEYCPTCPMRSKAAFAHSPGPLWEGRHGLLWIGEKFYPTPEDWTRESHERGASRRLSAVPKDLVIGETYVMVAHRKVQSRPCPRCLGCGFAHPGKCSECPPLGEKCPLCSGEGLEWAAGIFHVFKPTALEYIVKGDETDNELLDLTKRGFRLVNVIEATKEESDV